MTVSKQLMRTKEFCRRQRNSVFQIALTVWVHRIRILLTLRRSPPQKKCSTSCRDRSAIIFWYIYGTDNLRPTFKRMVAVEGEDARFKIPLVYPSFWRSLCLQCKPPNWLLCLTINLRSALEPVTWTERNVQIIMFAWQRTFKSHYWVPILNFLVFRVYKLFRMKCLKFFISGSILSNTFGRFEWCRLFAFRDKNIRKLLMLLVGRPSLFSP